MVPADTLKVPKWLIFGGNESKFLKFDVKKSICGKNKQFNTLTHDILRVMMYRVTRSIAREEVWYGYSVETRSSGCMRARCDQE